MFERRPSLPARRFYGFTEPLHKLGSLGQSNLTPKHRQMRSSCCGYSPSNLLLPHFSQSRLYVVNSTEHLEDHLLHVIHAPYDLRRERVYRYLLFLIVHRSIHYPLMVHHEQSLWLLMSFVLQGCCNSYSRTRGVILPLWQVLRFIHSIA